MQLKQWNTTEPAQLFTANRRHSRLQQKIPEGIYAVLCCCARTLSHPTQAFPSAPCLLMEHRALQELSQEGADSTVQVTQPQQEPQTRQNEQDSGCQHRALG